MKKIVFVQYRDQTKSQACDAQELEIKEGDFVLVSTENGLQFGRAVSSPAEIEDDRRLAVVARKATEKDIATHDRHKSFETEAMKVFADKIEKHRLPMKPVGAEYAFDESKLAFYFTADSRVDFRELVKDLASHFHTRIDLRQIGIRDECKMLGGMAPCGRVCCCANHLKDFTHVSVKMVKMQGLSLNPVKISGLCGRLMCCLQYESDHYSETARHMPKIGSDVVTPDGPGIAVSANLLKDEVRVKTSVNGGYEYRDYPAAALKITKRMLNSSGGDSRRDEDDRDELPQE